jgi:hypothetical protein
VDYLLWWLRDAPVPVPLATANATGLPVLGRPGTGALYGGADRDLGLFSGVRIGAGGFFDPGRVVGFESSAFFLEQRSAFFSAGSNSAGSPSIGAPFFNDGFAFNTPPGNEDVYLLSGPGQKGTVAARNSSRLWGVDANGLLNLGRGSSWNVNLLAGFRYLDLGEELNFYGRGELPTGDFFTVADSFRTRNQFYGGQVGSRVGYQWGRFSGELDARLALGCNHEMVNVGGQSIVSVGGTATPSSGGVFALPTNITRQSRNGFAAVVDAQLKIGYAVTEHLRLTVGYEFLYWTNVARPGDQIDRTLNRSQELGRTLVGAARPTPLFNTSSFWAHGLNFGAELHW